MKKKYSLTIADMQISVISDGDPADVEKVVGILDRKMREINLKSRSCSKNEAAILCALEFCSDRLSLMETNAELDAQNQKYATVLDAIQEQISALKAENERLAEENDALRAALVSGSVTPAEFLAEVAEENVKEAAPTEETTPTDTTDPKEPPRKSRSRVGSMFDLLSFNEV